MTSRFGGCRRRRVCQIVRSHEAEGERVMKRNAERRKGVGLCFFSTLHNPVYEQCARCGGGRPITQSTYAHAHAHMRTCFAQAQAPRRDWEPPRPRHRDFIPITKTHRSQLPGPSCRRRARRRRRAFACSPCRTPLADASEDPRRSRHLQPWCAASWPISLNLLLILSLEQMTWKREEEYEEGNGEQALFRLCSFLHVRSKKAVRPSSIQPTRTSTVWLLVPKLVANEYS